MEGLQLYASLEFGFRAHNQVLLIYVLDGFCVSFPSPHIKYFYEIELPIIVLPCPFSDGWMVNASSIHTSYYCQR